MPEELRMKLNVMVNKNTNLDIEDEELSIKQKISMTQSQKKKAKESKGDLAGNALFDKSKCCDVFNDVIVDDLNMYEQRSDRVKLQMKFKRMQMTAMLTKTKFMLGVGGLSDIFFIQTTLRKIQLQKKLFVLELEGGQEVYIPNELSVDSYPRCFSYYDPVIQIVNSLFNRDNQVYHTLKTEFNLDKIKGSDQTKDTLIKIGILENPEKPQLFSREQLINERLENQVNHVNSHHSISLQKSRYILVDSDEARLTAYAQHQVQQDENQEDFRKYLYTNLAEQDKSIEDKLLNLRYCHNDEVTNKRHKFIKFKQTYYQKHDHLKNNGQKFGTVKLLQSFIKNNLEHLYAIRPKQVDYGQNKFSIGLDEKPHDELTGRQKNLLHKDKLKYEEWLLTVTEDKIMARRAHIRMACVATIYEECSGGVGYNQKNMFLEDRIETTHKYFDVPDDLNKG